MIPVGYETTWISPLDNLEGRRCRSGTPYCPRRSSRSRPGCRCDRCCSPCCRRRSSRRWSQNAACFSYSRTQRGHPQRSLGSGPRMRRFVVSCAIAPVPRARTTHADHRRGVGACICSPALYESSRTHATVRGRCPRRRRPHRPRSRRPSYKCQRREDQSVFKLHHLVFETDRKPLLACGRGLARCSSHPIAEPADLGMLEHQGLPDLESELGPHLEHRRQPVRLRNCRSQAEAGVGRRHASNLPHLETSRTAAQPLHARRRQPALGVEYDEIVADPQAP